MANGFSDRKIEFVIENLCSHTILIDMSIRVFVQKQQEDIDEWGFLGGKIHMKKICREQFRQEPLVKKIYSCIQRRTFIIVEN